MPFPTTALQTFLLAQSTQDHNEAVLSLVVAAAGVLISAFVAWLTAMWAIRGDERCALREGNMRLMEWAIEYPYLEATAFCESWPNTGRSEDENMRYETFCCHVFNLLQQCWEFCNGDRSRMQHILFPDELIWMHRRWWESDDLNQKAYPVGFRQFVAERLRALEKEKQA